MKLAFTGTHATGKTTLLDAYTEHRKCQIGRQNSFGYIKGIARNILSRGFPLNKDGNIYSYVNYINDQLEAEKKMSEFEDFISDRTLLSPLAYALTNTALPRPFIPDYFISMMENIWLMEKERYDLYLYFPIEFPMICVEGVHPADNEYRKQVDVTIHNLLKKHNIRHIHITGTVEARLDKLIRIFKDDYNIN
jgi:hypothetical protein